MKIVELIKKGLSEVKWVSYACNCEVERKKVSDLLEQVETKHRIEVIKQQMSLLSNLRCYYDDTHYIDCEYNELEKQLKELEGY